LTTILRKLTLTPGLVLVISEHDSVRKINLQLGNFPLLLSFPFLITLALLREAFG
jgi:hypothetical protein